MSPVTAAQAESIRARIMRLSRPSVTVADVQVEEEDGPDGSAVLVIITLSAADEGGEWNADEFRFVRREARTVAVELLGGAAVRLVYEAPSSPESAGDESQAAGDKQTDDEVD